MKRLKSIIWGFLTLLCTGLLIFSLYNILSQYWEYKTADDEYAKLSEIARLEVEDSSADSGAEVSKIPIDFEALRDINPDIVGWIAVDGTNIDYPIVQGYDNEFYLSITYNGRSNSSGAIFLDSRNNSDFTDRNNIIYGHKMKDGTMFAGLTDYKSQSFYEEHPAFTLYTPDGEYRCEVFAAYITPSVSEAYTLDFADGESFMQYLDAAADRSLIKSDLALYRSDRIVTLSTCDYTYSDARMIVHARMADMKPADS